MLRPETFSHEKRDCTVRALASAANIPYDKAHTILKQLGRKDGRGVTFRKIAQDVFKSTGIQVKLVKRSGTVRKLIQLYPNATLYCLKSGHAFTIKEGKILDNTSENSIIKRAYLIK